LNYHDTKLNTIDFLLTAERALISDPVTRVGGEKTSCNIPTYEMLKGVLSSVYWKPTLIWIIDELRVMNSIMTESEGIRLLKYNDGGPDLSIYTYLKNVRYQVRAHFIWNENRPELEGDRISGKHYNIARRMIERGGRRDIFLGTRECQGYVEPCEFGSGEGAFDNTGTLDMGYMFHGFTYPDEAFRSGEREHLSVRFWHASMVNGYVKFPAPEDIEDKDRRVISEMTAKIFKNNRNFTGTAEPGLEQFAEEESQ